MIDGFLMGPSPLIQTVAREYDSTATYRVGDYCTRDGKIYKCTTAISTAENFDTSHWEFVVICDEFASQLGIVEKTNTATHNITSGQYVIWKGLLYTASSTITSGDTLSDSNLTRVENGGLNSLSSKMLSFNDYQAVNPTGTITKNGFLYYSGAGDGGNPAVVRATIIRNNDNLYYSGYLPNGLTGGFIVPVMAGDSYSFQACSGTPFNVHHWFMPMCD